MGVGGHAEGRGQSTKKKEKERAPSICTLPLRVSFLCEASSGPSQGSEIGCCGGKGAGGAVELVASCPLHTAWPSWGESRASSPCFSRQEQWQHIVPSRGTEHDWA